jgi:RNA polymerase sigma factor (sigma-70 family)
MSRERLPARLISVRASRAVQPDVNFPGQLPQYGVMGSWATCEDADTARLSDGLVIGESANRPALFREIFVRHHRAVWRFLARRYDGSLAEEITAATFAEAFGARTRFDSTRADARPWLMGIAVNLARAHRRREQAQLRLSTRGRREGSDDLAGDALDRRGALAAALNSLEERDRETLLLFALADLSYAGIAEALGVPEGTVRSRLNRARRIVKEALER